MDKTEIELNRAKLKNFVPLPEHLQKMVKVKKARKVSDKNKQPWKPKPGTLTFYVLEILNEEMLKYPDNPYMHYNQVVSRLRSCGDESYRFYDGYKNVATLLYNLAKEGKIRKSCIYKGHYAAMDPADLESDAQR